VGHPGHLDPLDQLVYLALKDRMDLEVLLDRPDLLDLQVNVVVLESEDQMAASDPLDLGVNPGHLVDLGKQEAQDLLDLEDQVDRLE